VKKYFVFSLFALLTACIQDGDSVSLSLGTYQGPSEYSSDYRYVTRYKLSGGAAFELNDWEYSHAYTNGQVSEDFPDLTQFCKSAGSWKQIGVELAVTIKQTACIEGNGSPIDSERVRSIVLDVVLVDSQHQVKIPIKSITANSFLASSDTGKTWQEFLKVQ